MDEFFDFDSGDPGVPLPVAYTPSPQEQLRQQIPTDQRGRWSLGNILYNMQAGFRQGTLLDNLLLEDPEVKASRDLPVVRILSLVGGAIGEGVLTQSWMLRGLSTLSKAKNLGKASQLAKVALDDYLVGEEIEVVRRIAGHAALNMAGEAALNVAGGVDAETGVTNTLLAGVGGAGFGAFQFARAAKAGAKMGFETEVAEGLSPLAAKFEKARSFANQNLRFEANLRKYAGFDNLAGRDLSDEIADLTKREGHRARGVERALWENIAKPIRSLEDKAAWKQFFDLVEASEAEGYKRAGIKKAGREADESMTLEELENRRKALFEAAPKEVQFAFHAHRAMVQEIAMVAQRYYRFGSAGTRDIDEVMQGDIFAAAGRGGSADAAEAGDVAYAHFLADMDAYMDGTIGHKQQFLRRGSFVDRTVEDAEGVKGYFERMGRAMYRAEKETLMDEFLQNVEKTHAYKEADLSFEAQRALLNDEVVVLPDGTRLKAFNKRPGTIYPEWATSEAGAAEWNKAWRDSKWHYGAGPESAGGEVRMGRMETPRPIWAIEPPQKMILPADIADSLTRKFYNRDPFAIKTPGLKQLQQATAAWKINTIWWGLTRFAGTQLIGDGINGFRSFGPGMFRQVPEAMRIIFAKYRTPIRSPEQLQASLVGAGAGAALGLTDLDVSDGVISGALAGAGLGYAFKTARLAGTLNLDGPMMERIAVYDAADDALVINTGQFVAETDLQHRIMGGNVGERVGEQASSGSGKTVDNLLTFLTGRIHGDPGDLATSWVQKIEVVQNERENLLRLAAYMQQLEDGIHPKVASKRVSAAFVDYTRFSDFENKYLRGFALPFYSFARHNTANWMRTLGGMTQLADGTRLEGVVPRLGGDVGGRPQAALLATAALGGFDIAAQAWNQAFFGDVEEKLEPWQRDGFHIIMGNPLTGEAYTDKLGRAMVMRTELGYESTLELLGLARPSKVLNLFGAAIPDEQSILERALLIQDYEDSALHVRESLGAFGDEVYRLLTPAVRIPAELLANKSFMFSAPLVPEEYRGTPQQWEFTLKYLAQQTFRQYREGEELGGELGRDEYNPVTSPFGLGLPFDAVDLDRSLRRQLHTKMELATNAEAREKAPWKASIDDLIYARPRWDMPEPDEFAKLQEILVTKVDDPKEYEQATRYYMERASKSSVLRHWNTLRGEERVRFINSLSKGDLAALTFYTNGGGRIDRYLEPSEEEMAAVAGQQPQPATPVP